MQQEDMTMRKIAYGCYDGKRYILQPIKGAPFMVPVPAAVFHTKDEAHAAATSHGYKVMWDGSVTNLQQEDRP
jgi:hypothetical protein